MRLPVQRYERNEKWKQNNEAVYESTFSVFILKEELGASWRLLSLLTLNFSGSSWALIDDQHWGCTVCANLKALMRWNTNPQNLRANEQAKQVCTYLSSWSRVCLSIPAFGTWVYSSSALWLAQTHQKLQFRRLSSPSCGLKFTWCSVWTQGEPLLLSWSPQLLLSLSGSNSKQICISHKLSSTANPETFRAVLLWKVHAWNQNFIWANCKYLLLSMAIKIFWLCSFKRKVASLLKMAMTESGGKSRCAVVTQWEGLGVHVLWVRLISSVRDCVTVVGSEASSVR